MKNLYLIISVILAISITSCSILKSESKKNSSSPTISKEQMLMDAYALANIECEYKLSQLKLVDNRNDFKLRSEFNTTKEDITTLSKLVFKRYTKVNGLRSEFDDMVISVKMDLTTCRQLQEYEIKRAEKNIENSNKEENNTNNKK